MNPIRAALAALLVPLAIVLTAVPADAAQAHRVCKRVASVDNHPAAEPHSTFCLDTWYIQSGDRVTITRLHFWEAEGNSMHKVVLRYRIKNEHGTTIHRLGARTLYGDNNFNDNRYPNKDVNAPGQVTAVFDFTWKDGVTSPQTRRGFLHVGPIGVDLG